MIQDARSHEIKIHCLLFSAVRYDLYFQTSCAIGNRQNSAEFTAIWNLMLPVELITQQHLSIQSVQHSKLALSQLRLHLFSDEIAS
jgi:hypothetical protein